MSVYSHTASDCLPVHTRLLALLGQIFDLQRAPRVYQVSSLGFIGFVPLRELQGGLYQGGAFKPGGLCPSIENVELTNNADYGHGEKVRCGFCENSTARLLLKKIINTVNN